MASKGPRTGRSKYLFVLPARLCVSGPSGKATLFWKVGFCVYGLIETLSDPEYNGSLIVRENLLTSLGPLRGIPAGLLFALKFCWDLFLAILRSISVITRL